MVEAIEKKQLNDAIDELAGKKTSVSMNTNAYQTVVGRSY
jgi:hypothetical protein